MDALAVASSAISGWALRSRSPGRTCSLCFIGCLLGTIDRRAARHRPAHHHGDGAAVHVLARAGRRADHAVGRVLRRPIRRLDHRDPGQDSGRDLVGRHHPRRPRHGPAGPRRPGARHRGDRIAVRRLGGDPADRGRRPAARLDRAAVPVGRLRLGDAARAGLGGGARARLGAQGDRHDRARRAVRAGRHRYPERRLPHDHGARRAVRRARLRADLDGRLRPRRDHVQHRARRQARQRARPGDRPDADPQGPARPACRR